ncbi:MAG: GNAT family N-acetyltransferase [Thermoplasmata archaeon]|nr:GNAT family N-acetyltransferase [Thermoplasmata archaeon]
MAPSSSHGKLRRGSGVFRAAELTSTTWADFEALFGRFNGVAGGCWCMFYHRTRREDVPHSRARTERNRRDHRALVRKGRAHGILVYHEEVPVGWCQFGRRAELPLIDTARTYRALLANGTPPAEWRITCFFVDPSARHRGAARFGLRAALAAIRRAGGGVVEAYPATLGAPVSHWFGTLSMFEREGFRETAPYGTHHRLVRRRLLPDSRRPKPPTVTRRT